MELPQNTIELPLVLVGWKSLRFTHISVRYISKQTHSRVYAVTVYVHTYHNTNHTNPYPNTHTHTYSSSEWTNKTDAFRRIAEVCGRLYICICPSV